MFARLALTVALLLSIGPAAVAGQGSRDRQFWDWLVVQAREIDFDQEAPHRAVSMLLSLARSCHAMEQVPLADEYFRRALAIDEENESIDFDSSFFDYAVATDQLALAERIAEDSESDSLLDRWDLERFRRGNCDAIQNYPREKMSFYNAYGLATAYVRSGDYDGAEKFVTGIESTVGNSPEEVAGLTFKAIALRYREDGDMENAKRYIDKALAIAHGRGTGYVGYAIEITHRSMHEVLTNDLDEFAQQGAYFPAHMGLELVGNLITELVLTGHDEKAKRAAMVLTKPEDERTGLRRVASAQARRGDITAALKTVEEMEDTQTMVATRLEIARVLGDSGKTEAAAELADLVFRGLKNRRDKEREQIYKRLAYLYGRLHSQPQLEQLLAQVPTSELKADCIRSSIRGFAGAASK